MLTPGDTLQRNPDAELQSTAGAQKPALDILLQDECILQSMRRTYNVVEHNELRSSALTTHGTVPCGCQSLVVRAVLVTSTFVASVAIMRLRFTALRHEHGNPAATSAAAFIVPSSEQFPPPPGASGTKDERSDTREPPPRPQLVSEVVASPPRPSMLLSPPQLAALPPPPATRRCHHHHHRRHRHRRL